MTLKVKCKYVKICPFKICLESFIRYCCNDPEKCGYYRIDFEDFKTPAEWVKRLDYLIDKEDEPEGIT